MLGLHRTSKGLTYDQKIAKLAVTRELVGMVICSSYVTPQNLLLNTRNNLGQLVIEIDKLHDRF